MYIKIRHTGLNGHRETSRLHSMIQEGFKNSFKTLPTVTKSQSTDTVPVEPLTNDDPSLDEKKKFVEAINDMEIDFLKGGFRYA